MLEYRLRAATAEDVRFLADVVIEATRAQGRLGEDFDEPDWREKFSEWTMEQVRGEAPGGTISVIEVAGERIGRLRVTRTATSIELPGIQLLSRFQGRGIGTAIIEDLQAQASAAGVPLDLEVEKDNPDARRLYERLGFVDVGETEQEHQLRWNPPSAASEEACVTCAANARQDPPPRERIYVGPRWRIAHAFGTALPGWLVVLPRRHVVTLDELTRDEAADLGPLLRAATAALRQVTGCAKTYVALFAEAEGFSHVHFHVIPRQADLEPQLHGPRVFGLLGGDPARHVTETGRDQIASDLAAALPAYL